MLACNAAPDVPVDEYGNQRRVESSKLIVDWVVIELDACANSQIGISLPQTIDFIEVDSGMITIVICESDVG